MHLKSETIVMTPSIAEMLQEEVGFVNLMENSLRRHLNGDWGDVEDQRKELNDAALENGGQIVSCYSAPGFSEFFIITEPDRSVTTVLFPEEG